jgi:hypothetical protein
MRPLFVAYYASVKNQSHHGWVVVEAEKITTGAHVDSLCRAVEEIMNFPRNSAVVTNFRRLED